MTACSWLVVRRVLVLGSCILAAACGGGGGGGTTNGGNAAGTVSRIDITPAAVADYWGYSVQLRGTALDATGHAIDPAPAVAWSSADASVASVGSTGRVELRRPGATTVSASSGSASASTRVDVLGLEGLARGHHDTVCALGDKRLRIFCWGDGGTVQNPVIAPWKAEHAQPTPIARGEIAEGEPVRKVVLALFSACALTDAGSAYCWGENETGALGSGTTDSVSAPRRVARGAIPAGVRLLDVSGSPGNTYCAAGDDGRLYCWGSHDVIPNPGLSSTGFSTAPVATVRGAIPPTTKIVRVALSTNTGCALGADGEAYCWGNGSREPVRVAQGERPVGSNFTDIQIGDDLACGVATDGEAYCWGTAFGRRFGIGSDDFIFEAGPTRVAAGSRPPGVKLESISVGSVSISSCAIGNDGKAYCWGGGYEGSLGDGNLEQHDALTPITLLDGEKDHTWRWRSVNCATYTCSALASDKRVYNWGSNQSDALSRPQTHGSSATPLMVARVIRP